MNKWSNDVLGAVVGLSNGVAVSGVDFDVTGNVTSDVTATPVINVDTGKVSDVVSDKDTEKQEKIRQMLEQFTNNGVLIRTDELPLRTTSPELLSYIQNYVPQMAVSVNHTIPEMIKNRNEQTVVNNHYDCLLKVEGNVDKDFAKVLPQHLEEAYKYTIGKMKYAAKLNGNNTPIRQHHIS